MSLHRWLVLIGGLLLVFLLFSLPKVVVDNDAVDTEITQSSTSEIEETHSFSFSQKDQDRRDALLNLLDSSSVKEKSTIFADSLARLYLSYNKLDSASHFADVILALDSSINGQRLAGEIYFQLFGIALNQADLAKYAKKAQDCFQIVIAEQEDPDTKAKLAMTKVISDNPMEGIGMLREILEEYPDNITALYSLGLLSMQSGQYDKAVERFEKLMTIDPANQQAAFLLATSYFETNQREKAKQWFENIKSTGTDPAIISSTDQYLKELNEL
ncbi:tetratricopeptide repeat protein [Reichenbachiella agarivorans]|uniref:Tetratricopeptide repeat protein n=1 Tax=Reichenbachiella agarivorans TaxID=2979464 RepID=A0ABY6CSV1_9BACT|nr:tetratricopeptide repeat protein [Reichenbachiella agarivorans]UXP33590.1 tetratricopeptide repeat protein [Reichenbachiella agarivorans]